MNSRPIVSTLLLVISTNLASAQPPDPEISVVHQRKIDGGVDALPRLKPMPGVAFDRINSALARLDAEAREASNDKYCTYGRKVSIPMAGPNFLKVRLDEDNYCGGPYPSSWVTAITYDLLTGKPVDWVDLLGPKLGGTTNVDEKTGKATGTLSSPELFRLWKKARDASENGPGDDCEDTPHDDKGSLQVWADARKGGIVVESTDVVHATAVCGMPAVIPLRALRDKGVSAQLLDSIAAGKRTATHSH